MEVVDRDQVRPPIPVDVAEPVALEAAGAVLVHEGVAFEPAAAVVLEPVDVVVDARADRGAVGARQVEVAVAVQVGGGDAVDVGVVAGDQVLLEGQVGNGAPARRREPEEAKQKFRRAPHGIFLRLDPRPEIARAYFIFARRAIVF